MGETSMILRPGRTTQTWADVAVATRSLRLALRQTGPGRHDALHEHFVRFPPAIVDRRVCSVH